MATEQAHAHGGHDDGHDDDDGAVHVHIGSNQSYVGIFLALIALTFVTVKVSYYDFGSANIIIAMVVATMKATLVAAFFMHLRYDKLFNTLAFLASFFFLAIFILLTYDDLGNRGKVDPNYGGMVNIQTGVAAPGGAPATTATQDDVVGEAAPQGSGAPGGGEKPKKE
jgi:cytochrome c oxidase subunit 4